MRRFLLGCFLAMLAGDALAAKADIDVALDLAERSGAAGDFAGSVDLLRPYAKSGNADVEYYLGFAHMNLAINGTKPGDVRSDAMKLAIHFTERAAKHGSKEAWNLLYQIHGNGWGVPVDDATALDYLRRGVAAGDNGAKLNYAIMLYVGSRIVPKNVDKACPLILDLAREDSTLSTYYLGLIVFKGQCGKTADKAAGIELVQIAADHGVRDAERDMGKNHEFGWTGVADNTKALAWYGKAADHGDPESQWRMGMVYVNGELGQAQDFAKARGYFEGAAASEYSKAFVDLGTMYAAGEGGDKDFAKASDLYERAAKVGNARAFRELAVMHANGEGMAVDLVAARVLYLKALQAGWPDEAPLKEQIESKLGDAQMKESDRLFEAWRKKHPDH